MSCRQTPNWKFIETLSSKISSWSLATLATAEPFTALPMGLSLSAGDPLVSIRTHIRNDLFASFSTTDFKSRLNFLRLLCQPKEQYRLCEEARVCIEFPGAGILFQAKINGLEDGV